MKKYLGGILAVIFAIAFSAFTVTGTSEKVSGPQSLFYWYNGSSYTGFKTKSAEMTASGCQDLVTPNCRTGFNSDDLIDPAHPELGLKAGAVPDEIIKRTN